jgi:hypothetical protein
MYNQDAIVDQAVKKNTNELRGFFALILKVF